jgi:Concanavalin A-like lectin/glucanases superfamily/Calx-beta domain
MKATPSRIFGSVRNLSNFRPRRRMAAACLLCCVALAALNALGQSPEAEPNDTPGFATPLALSRNSFGAGHAVMTGEISPAGDVDYYSFPAPFPLSPNTVLRVSIYVDTGGAWNSPPANSRNSFVALLDSDLLPVEVDDNDGTGNGRDGITESGAASVISGAVLSLPGQTYYIVVSNAVPGGMISPYSLFVVVEVTDPFGALPATESIGPNNTAAQALASGNLLLISDDLPATADGTIAAAGDVDFWGFVATAGTVLHIEADGNPDNLGRPALNTDLILDFHNASGVSLLSAVINSSTLAEATRPDGSANPLAEGFAFEVPTDGMYFVSVAASAVAPFPRPYRLLIDPHSRGRFSFAPTYSVVEGAGSATITVTRNDGDYGTASVEFRAESGSATAGVDFTATSGTLVFSNGVTSLSFFVPIQNDSLSESNETVRLFLTNSTTSIGLGTATLVIYDDDDSPDDDPATARVLDAAAGLATASGRISPPGDVDYFAFYAPAGAKVSLLTDLGGPREIGDIGGATRMTLLDTDGLTPIEADITDGTATGFGVAAGRGFASAIAGRTLPVAGTYYVRIEGAGPTLVVDPYWLVIGLSTNLPVAEVEPNDILPNEIDLRSWPVVVRSGNIATPSDVDYYSFVVRPGSDIFVSVDGDPSRGGSNTDVRLEFRTPEGVVLRADSSQLAGVGAANPSLAEAFCWRDTNDPGQIYYDSYTLKVSGQNTGRYELTVNVRSAGEFMFSEARPAPCGERLYLAGENSGLVTATVLRANGNAGTATVRFATSNETALAGADYWPTNGVLIFTNGETRKTFEVRMINDPVPEPTESLKLDLSAPTGGAIVEPPKASVCFSSATGGEGIRLYIVDEGQPAHDTIASATPLDVRRPLVEARGTISPLTGHPEHWYSFVNPQPGAKVWLLVDTGGPLPAPIFTRDSLLLLWRLNETNGLTLVEQDDDDGTGNGGDASIESALASAIAGRTLPGPGTYYLQVLPFPYDLGTKSGADPTVVPVLDYRLFVALTTTVALPEIEPANDTAATASPIVGLTTPVGQRSGQLSSTNDVDNFPVIASRGDQLFVSLSGNPQGGSTRTDTRIVLIAPNGTNVLAADSSGGRANTDSAPAESFAFDVPQTGTWLVSVRAGPTFEQTSRAYELLVVRQSPPGPVLNALTITSPVATGSNVVLQAQIVGVGPSDTFTLRVDWGDGSGLQTVQLPMGANSFSVSHVYDTGGLNYPVDILLNNETRGGSTSFAASVNVCLARPAGLIAWWAGDGNARDLVGNNHGTLLGTTFATGLAGQAFNLNGNGDLVRMGDVLDPRTNSFSVEAWYRNTRWPDGGVGRILSKGLTAVESRTQGYDIELYETHLRFQAGGDRGNWFIDASAPALGVFHHLVAVLDRADRLNQRMRLYVDGGLAVESVRIDLGNIDVSTSFSLGAQDYFPNMRDGQPAVHFFPGQIDEVAYYNRALTAAEIQAIYVAGAAGKCKSGPIIQQLVPTRLANSPLPGSNQLVLAWPASLNRLALEAADNLTPPVTWTPVTAMPVEVDGQMRVSVPTTNGHSFYRLRLP